MDYYNYYHTLHRQPFLPPCHKATTLHQVVAFIDDQRLPPLRPAADNFACPVFSDAFLPASARLFDERDLLVALPLDIFMMASPFVRLCYPTTNFLAKKMPNFSQL